MEEKKKSFSVSLINAEEFHERHIVHYIRFDEVEHIPEQFEKALIGSICGIMWSCVKKYKDQNMYGSLNRKN